MKDAIELSVSDIKELMEALHRNRLSALKIRKGDFSLLIEGVKAERITETAAVSPAAAVISPSPADEGEEHKGNVVKSPIVGTFYSSPSPDSEPYVKAGSRVKKGDVLFIIESMKLMNEVTSDYDGEVSEILVENAQSVEYGQPILVLSE